MSDEPEIVDGELELVAELRPVELERAPVVAPAVQAAASAAAGFVAGAATFALMHRLAGRRVTRGEPLLARRPEFRPVTSSRTYLVHVRTLGRPGE